MAIVTFAPTIPYFAQRNLLYSTSVINHKPRNELRNQQRRITIAQETEIVSQSIVVHFLPVAMEEGTDEEEKSALRLMELVISIFTILY